MTWFDFAFAVYGYLIFLLIFMFIAWVIKKLRKPKVVHELKELRPFNEVGKMGLREYTDYLTGEDEHERKE